MMFSVLCLFLKTFQGMQVSEKQKKKNFFEVNFSAGIFWWCLLFVVWRSEETDFMGSTVSIGVVWNISMAVQHSRNCIWTDKCNNSS